MKRSHSSAYRLTATGLLLWSLCFGAAPAGAQTAKVKAPATKGASVSSVADFFPAVRKFSPNLSKISPDLRAIIAKAETKARALRVICQFNAPAGRVIQQIYQRPNVTVDYSFQNSKDIVASMPASTVFELAEQKEIDFITPARGRRSRRHGRRHRRARLRHRVEPQSVP